MVETQTFDTIPILPLSHALDPATKPKFLEDLRHALLNVGFLYLSETGLPDQLIKDVIRECQGFFKELPQEEKEKIEMKNEKSFLGWSRVSSDFLVLKLRASVQEVHVWKCMIIVLCWSIAMLEKNKINQSIAVLEKDKIVGRCKNAGREEMRRES
jgi:hypothetical protein